MSAPQTRLAATSVAERDLGAYKHFDLFLAIFIVVLLISNLVAQKICAFGTIHFFGWIWTPTVSGAQLLFPITYIFGDVFTEVYGYGASRRAIWLGFFASGLMAVMGLIAVALPPAPGWHNQEAFATVFDFVPRLVIASLVAYWCGEFTNSYVLAKMKILTKGKYLWTRTIGSTVAGQFVDTAIVMVIAFGGSLTPSLIANLIVSGYLFKVTYEVLATPLTYAIVGSLKRVEGVDTFDVGTDFNPFHAGRV